MLCVSYLTLPCFYFAGFRNNFSGPSTALLAAHDPSAVVGLHCALMMTASLFIEPKSFCQSPVEALCS